MLLAYCTHRGDREHLRAILPRVNATEDWSVFEREALEGPVEGLIVFVPNLAQWLHLGGLQRLRHRRPGVPMTLITEPSIGNLVPVGTIEVDHILFPGDLTGLALCATRRRGRSFRSDVARRLRSEPKLSDRERVLLLTLLHSEPPPRSLPEWAKIAHASPSTIKYRFRRGSNRIGLPARVAVGINLLLAGLDSAPGALTWDSIAAAADVDRRRLTTAAREFGLPTGRVGPDLTDLAEEVANTIIFRLSGELGGTC